ncbi:MAG TPA: LLM class flavin-dependent oxidoreductase [Myxococcota bacterium]|nr:LLM class flavin-dependent oxidoreductase [Myxococcota bacterium]
MKAGFICANTYSDPRAWTSFAPPRGLYDAEVGRRTLATALEQARTADALGFDYVSVSEHHATPLMCSPNGSLLAGALTQIVRQARIAWLGPIVSINNPLRVAEEIAMLDQLSGGRLTVFLLRGTPSELLIYNNIDPAESRAITQEASLLIRKALGESEPFAWKGDHFDFARVSVWPGSTQKPHPPLFASGMSHDSVRFAARNRFPLAISFYPTPMVAELTKLYRDECDAAGWAPGADDILYRGFIAVGETDAQAAELAPRFAPQAFGNAKEDVGKGFGSLQFCGRPETVIAQIEAFQKATGAGILDLGFGGGMTHEGRTLESIRRFGTQVLPRIRGF